MNRQPQRWVITDARGVPTETIFTKGEFPRGNVMRCHAVDDGFNEMTQRFDRSRRAFVEDLARIQTIAHEAVMRRFADPVQRLIYERKEAEARGLAYRDVLADEAAEKRMPIDELAARVIERAEADRAALIAAIKWHEAQRRWREGGRG